MPSEREALNRLAAEICPGGRAVSLRRLPGGIGARMHVLTLETPDGPRSRVVLRRYVPGRGNHGQADAAAREFRTLSVLVERGITAPRPILLDVDGRFFQVPTIVESLVPGRPLVMPRDFGGWTHGLAAALVAIHRVTPRNADLSHLKTFLRAEMTAEVAKGTAGASTKYADLRRDPLSLRAQQALERLLPGVTWVEPCLVHDDYYPGNVLWHRGRVSGIVDWTTSEVGDRRADVAQCAIDIALMQALDVADSFLRDYEDLSGSPVPDLDFWMLYRGLRAYGRYPAWLKGYHDLGLRHLTLDDLKRRIEALLRRALDRAVS
jgi:aminoglycoside phosphotransferase (APT) family kinase protein